MVAGLFGSISKQSEVKTKEENLELIGVLGLLTSDKIEDQERAARKKEEEKAAANQKNQPSTAGSKDLKSQAANPSTNPAATTQNPQQPQTSSNPNNKPQAPNQFPAQSTQQSAVATQKTNQPLGQSITKPPDAQPENTNFFAGLFGNKAQEKPQDQNQNGFSPFKEPKKPDIDSSKGGNIGNALLKNAPGSELGTQFSTQNANPSPAQNQAKNNQAGSQFAQSNPQPLNHSPTFGNNSQASSQAKPQPTFGGSLNLSNMNPNSGAFLLEDDDDPMSLAGNTGNFC